MILRVLMKTGDLVRHKEKDIFGIVEWNLNQSSWWHRKKGLTAVAILITTTGETVWWSPKEIEVICESR